MTEASLFEHLNLLKVRKKLRSGFCYLLDKKCQTGEKQNHKAKNNIIDVVSEP